MVYLHSPPVPALKQGEIGQLLLDLSNSTFFRFLYSLFQLISYLNKNILNYTSI